MKISGDLSLCGRSNSHPSVSFKKFEGKEVYGLMDKNGNFAKKIIESLETSNIYQDLCQQYDVIVKMGTVADPINKQRYISRCEIYYKPTTSKDNWLKKMINILIKPYQQYEKIQFDKVQSSQYNAESALTSSTGVLLYKIKEVLHK